MTSSTDFQRRRQKGQALVETILIVVLLTMVVFACIDMCLWCVNNLIFGEAVFSINRVGVVTPEPRFRESARDSALFLLPRQISMKHCLYDPSSLDLERTPVGKNESGEVIESSTVGISYVTRIMFGELFDGQLGSSMGGPRTRKGYAVSKLVKSPAEEYYERAYPHARAFK